MTGDKIKHMIAGFVISLLSIWVNPLIALLLVAIAGIGKEVYDNYFGGVVDVNDFYATVAGGFPVSLLFALIG